MIILDSSNRILHDTIKERLEAEKPAFVDILFSDFDGVKFHVSCAEGAHNVITISLSWACAQALLKNGGKESLQMAYGPMLLATPESGFDVSLQVDVATVEEDKKNRLPFHVSLLKRNLFAGPFQRHFNGAGEKKAVPKLEIKYRSNESMWFVTDADRVTVVLNIRFNNADDQVLGKVFLDQFVSMRGGMNQAPSVNFSLVEIPLEIQGMPGVREEPNQSFLTLVMHPRHTNPKARGVTINMVQQLRVYLQYHLACSKAYMHTRMRATVAKQLLVLNRAKVEPLVKVQRTAKGKVFKKRT